jgi:hypothetical protein
MESRKFTAYNKTRDRSLSISVTAVNAALEPLKVLKVLIEGLPGDGRTGLWLTNFKGVPVARTLSPFDLVYLDQEHRVIHGIELSKDGEFAPFRGKPASALVLPPKSLTTSQTRDGDLLELRPLEQDVSEDAVETSAPIPAPEVLAKPIPPVVSEPSPSTRFFSSMSSAPAPQPEPPPSAPASALNVEPQVDKPAAQIPPASLQPEPPAIRIAPAQDFFTPAPRPVRPPDWKPDEVFRAEEVSPTPPVKPEQPEEPWQLDSAVQISKPSLVKPGTRLPEKPAAQADAEATAAQLAHYQDYAPVPKKKYSWKIQLLRWLFPQLIIDEPDQPIDRRRADRQTLPGLVAYFFTGGSPEAQRIANISVTGFYLHTDERWMPGTVVRMTLQRVGSTGEDPADTITVNSRIVRWGSDGEGFEFILTDLEE